LYSYIALSSPRLRKFYLISSVFATPKANIGRKQQS
jgi:hypothetical protein